jgi:asparagine synthase (glutamine-hydrolysing)
VKPFYYHFDGKKFSFGSEIKQVLVLPWVSRDVHPGVLFDFIAFNTYGCNSEHTFYREVMDMRGGHYMLVPLGERSSGWQPCAVRWWDIDLRNKTIGWTDEQYASQYLELFEDAVRLRLRSDVPVGSCLSGGLDSSGIVCVVDKLLHEAGVTGLQKTFTATSDVEGFDETSYAKAVIDATRVDPSFVLPTPQRLLKDLNRLTWHQEEPFLSTSIFAGWCVYGLARNHGVTVTLDGQGPDEMHGGYVPFSYQSLLADTLAHADFGSTLQEVRGLSRNFGLGYRQMTLGLVREFFHGKIPVSLMPSMKRAREIFTEISFEEGCHNSIFLRELSSLAEWKSRVGGTRFDRHLYRLTTRDSLPGILRQVDRNAMAFSIEARLPFLDYRLVEYTFSLPADQRLSGGIAKRVYRRALSNVLPNAIRDRVSKLGFVTAEPHWIKGPMRGAFEACFEDIKSTGPFNRETLRSELSGLVAGTKPFTTTPWKVFCTEMWRNTSTSLSQQTVGVPVTTSGS